MCCRSAYAASLVDVLAAYAIAVAYANTVASANTGVITIMFAHMSFAAVTAIVALSAVVIAFGVAPIGSRPPSLSICSMLGATTSVLALRSFSDMAQISLDV